MRTLAANIRDRLHSAGAEFLLTCVPGCSICYLVTSKETSDWGLRLFGLRRCSCVEAAIWARGLRAWKRALNDMEKASAVIYPYDLLEDNLVFNTRNYDYTAFAWRVAGQHRSKVSGYSRCVPDGLPELFNISDYFRKPAAAEAACNNPRMLMPMGTDYNEHAYQNK